MSFVTESRKLLLKGGANPVYVCKFDVDCFAEAHFRSSGIRFPAELSGAVKKRKAEYLAGRISAKLALAEQGINGHFVATGLNREPIWPKNIVGSISHTEGMACAIVSESKACIGVGIDIEKVLSGGLADSIAHQFVDKNERRLIEQSHVLSPELITLTFSAKEAFFKAAHGRVRRYFDFSAIKLIRISTHSNKLTFAVKEKLGDVFDINEEIKADYLYLENDTVLTLVSLVHQKD